jgi:ATP-dependent Clp protease ATP-binding subunit ClpX
MKTYKIAVPDKKIVCSFCHKPQDEVAKIVGAPEGKAFICDECIKLCYEVVKEKPKTSK